MSLTDIVLHSIHYFFFLASSLSEIPHIIHCECLQATAAFTIYNCCLHE
jgi:hypothetical protein